MVVLTALCGSVSVCWKKTQRMTLIFLENVASFFVAQARKEASCLHEMPFDGRKNMEHDSAECSCGMIEQGKSSPARLPERDRQYGKEENQI